MSKNSDTMSELYVEENDSNLPKIHVFVKELTNWLGVTQTYIYLHEYYFGN